MGANLNATLTNKGISENTKKLITSIEHRSSSKTASERAKKVYQNQSGLGSPKNSRPANYLLSVEEKEAFLSKGANTNHHHQRFKGSGIGSMRGGERKRSNTRTGSNSRPQSAKKDVADKYLCVNLLILIRGGRYEQHLNFERNVMQVLKSNGLSTPSNFGEKRYF